MSETDAKPPARRTRKFKEEYVGENALLRMRVHQLEAEIAAWKKRSFWPRVLNWPPSTGCAPPAE